MSYIQGIIIIRSMARDRRNINTSVFATSVMKVTNIDGKELRVQNGID